MIRYYISVSGKLDNEKLDADVLDPWDDNQALCSVYVKHEGGRIMVALPANQIWKEITSYSKTMTLCTHHSVYENKNV